MSKDLYVKNLPLEMTEEELRRLFAVAGKVSYIHMVKDAKSGEFIGCAYVKMSSEAEAKDAIVCLDGARLINRDIVVVEALPQRPAGQKGAPGQAPRPRREEGRAAQSRKPAGERQKPRGQRRK